MRVDFGIVDYPSDDPRTPIVNDPTRDVVGNAPLLFATKAAALLNDLSSPGIVDPGDTLRYTITIYNNGAIPATSVLLQDNVPPNTTYVADSVTLNGLPVGQPDNGTSPLGTGIYVSSTDLTPPLPTTLEQGILSPNSSAVVTFDLRVNAGTPPGTIIRNQANVRTAEVPNLLTDGDGNPSTGPEPTVVVVGNAQQLTIAKEVSVVGGGAAVQGATLEYVVRVTNSSLVPALYVVITDDLNMPVPGYLTLVPNSATLNGQTTGITRRQSAHHGRLLHDLWAAAAAGSRDAALPCGHQSRSARRHADREHRHGDVGQPAAHGKCQRGDRRRRHPGPGHPERQGVARRELQPNGRSRTSASSKAGRSSCIATTGCCAA